MTEFGEFEALTAKAARVQAALRSVRGTSVSVAGEVSIETGIDGSITSIALGPSFTGLDAVAGADLIARTHSAALAAAVDAAAHIRRELLEDPRVGQLVGRALDNHRAGSLVEPRSQDREGLYMAPDPVPPSSIYDRW